MHPAITVLNSELFYDNKLQAIANNNRQTITSGGSFSGTGLRYVPVLHTGNQSSSIEEAEAVARIVDLLLTSSTSWVDRTGDTKTLALEDIIIIARITRKYSRFSNAFPAHMSAPSISFKGRKRQSLFTLLQLHRMPMPHAVWSSCTAPID
jgi:hypothetical protein